MFFLNMKRISKLLSQRFLGDAPKQILLILIIFTVRIVPCFATDLSIKEAKTLLLHGNYEEALDYYTQLEKKAESQQEAVIGMIECYHSIGHMDEATKLLEKYIKEGKNKPNPIYISLYADHLYQLGKFQEGLEWSQKALKIDENQIFARWTIARILRDQGKWKDADREFLWFIRYYSQKNKMNQDITDPDQLILIGQVGTERADYYHLTKQYRFILNEIYGEILKANPDYWRAEYLAGMMLLKKYNRRESIAAFEKALKINPRSAEALVGKGKWALQKLELKQADRAVQEALTINPYLPVALRLKADIEIASGDIQSAIPFLLKALKINAMEEATLGRLASCYYLLEKKDDFERICKQLKNLNPEPALGYLQMARVFEEKRFYRDAEKYYLLALELRKEMAEPKSALGLLYLRLGKEAEAKKLLEEAFKFDPFHIRVANSLKVLKHLDQYQTIQSKHFLLRYNSKTDRLLAVFLSDYLEEVYENLSKDFNYQPKEKFLFELFNNHEMFSGRTIALPDLHTVGACTGRVVTMVSPNGKGISSFFNWGRVVRHELVHLFNLDQTEFRMPHWFTEGLAVRNEGGKRPHLWERVLRDSSDKHELLNLDTIQLAFVRPRSSEQWTLAYCQSQIYIDYLTATHGKQVVAKFLEGYRNNLSDEAIILKVCGQTKAEFERGYRKHLKSIVDKIAKNPTPQSRQTLEEMEKAYTKQSGDLNLGGMIAEQYLRRRKNSEARKLAEKILAEDPTQPQAALVKAKLFILAGDEQKAISLLEKVLEARNEEIPVIVQLARLYLNAKKDRQAATLLEKGKKIAPTLGNWNPQLLKLYEQLNDTEKLVVILQELCDEDVDNLKYRLDLARIYAEGKQFIKLEAIAREALQINVLSKPAQDYLLLVLKEQNKQEELAKWEKRFKE